MTTTLPTLAQLEQLGAMSPNDRDCAELLSFIFELRQRQQREQEIITAYERVLARRAAQASADPVQTLQASTTPAPGHVAFYFSSGDGQLPATEIDGRRTRYVIQDRIGWVPSAYADAIRSQLTIPPHQLPSWLSGASRTRAIVPPEIAARRDELRSHLPIWTTLPPLPYNVPPSAWPIEASRFLSDHLTIPPTTEAIEAERARVAVEAVGSCTSRATLERWREIEAQPGLREAIVRMLERQRNSRGEDLR